MAFDKDSFMGQEYSTREESVPVPDLKEFFGDDDPVWKIRGLNASEIAKSREAPRTMAKMNAMVEALSSGTNREQIDAMREHLGINSSVHDDIKGRMIQLCCGSVEPKCNEALAGKLARVAPVTFYKITNRIIELTGLGSLPGKPRPSGGGTTSG